MSDTRRMECSECEGELTVEIQDGFDGPETTCPHCGHQLTDHANAAAIASDYFGCLEEAQAVALRYTYEEMMDASRRVLSDSATEKDVLAVMAFALLKSKGLPSHAPSKAN